MKKVLSVVLASTLFQVAFAKPQGDTVAPAKKEDSKLKDFATNIKLSGFGFGRFFTLNGFKSPAHNAQSQQYRIKLDATSGKVNGYSVTAGIFFSQGSSTPDRGQNTNGAVQGGRAAAYIDNFSDRFSISQIFASKEFDIHSMSVKVDLGKVNISSPLSDNKVDLGAGIVANAKHKIDGLGDFKYHAAFYDSWSGDHADYSIRRRSAVKDGKAIGTSQSVAGVSIGNNLVLLGVNGEVMNKALGFNAYAGNILGFADFLFYGEAKYGMKLDDSMKLTLLGQMSMVALNGKPRLYLGHGTNTVISKLDTKEALSNTAKFRSLFNLQARLAIDKLSLRAGYLMSFGDGYGTLIDYKGGVSTAGKIWNGNLTATYEGFGMFGSGSFKNSSIRLFYLAAEYSGFHIPLKVGLDIAYAFGNTYMPELKVSPYKKKAYEDPITKAKFIKNASFAEITPHVTYKFHKKLEISLLAATMMGDLNFFKTRTELKYTF